ncbi:MAG: ABC transporter ATP-binding protein [Lachnospiraceae bacterium]|nr:ABC transporter ATP-binding protein [Lachnospiraceae bacterium]
MNTENRNVRLPWFGIPKLIPYLKKYRRMLISMIVLGFAASLIDSIYPLFTRYALNHFIIGKTTDTLLQFVLLYLAVLLIQVAANFISVYQTGIIELDVDRDLRNAAFSHLQELSFSYFNQNNVGYIHARVISDTGKIGELVAWRMMSIVWSGSYLLFVVINMLILSVRLAMYMLLLIPLAAVLIVFFQKKLIVLNRRIRETNSKITGDFNEGITGSRSIKTLVVEALMKKDFERDTEEMRSVSVHAGRYSAAFTAVVMMLSSAALAIVLWKSGVISEDGVVMIGTLSVFMHYAMEMLEPIREVIETVAGIVAVQVNIERFSHLMETKSDVADTPEVIEKYGDAFNPKKENWEPLIGDVEFRDVSFHYPDGDEMVLEHFNLKVPHGTNVAIVGETGAGKSTLVNLVCRFFEPTEGEVLIDGVNATKRSQLWLHSNIGYVLQTPHLFSGSVRENLRYGNPHASDEEILRALKLVSAEGVLAKMDKGLDTDVGEGGDLLSTGEKQLLSFARAILADPRILVLDEATASIDTLTEKAIQDAIHTVIQGRTSFVIAHRLSTIVDADVILVVKDGKITERGTHKELMQQRGYYYELYSRQYEDMAADMIARQAD